MTLITDLSSEARRLLDAVLPVIDRTFPLAERFRRKLPGCIAELSRLLTSGRGERGAFYLGKPEMLSAYLRYFLPWNLYRLCRILPGLPLDLREGDVIADFGSGPLTLPSALWISRPGLRSVPLEFRCFDRTGAVLDAGKRFFAALAEFTGASGSAGMPWKIKTAAAALGAPVRGKPAALVTAANLFNELYQGIPHSDHAGLAKEARVYAGLLCRGPEGSVLVVEPGTPRAGEFIACLRAALAERGRLPLAPCPHSGPCPCPGASSGGRKTRWCHFVFDTGDAPAGLRKFSAAAGIPKERAAMSFLFAGPEIRPVEKTSAARGLPVRILSDPFPVAGGNLYGRYGCSEKGLVLVRGKRSFIGALVSGSLFTAEGEEARTGARPRDPVSGALVIDPGDMKAGS